MPSGPSPNSTSKNRSSDAALGATSVGSAGAAAVSPTAAATAGADDDEFGDFAAPGEVAGAAAVDVGDSAAAADEDDDGFGDFSGAAAPSAAPHAPFAMAMD